MKAVLRSSEAGLAGEAGRKAAALAVLGSRGFEVPPWVVLTDEAFGGDDELKVGVREELMAVARELVGDGGRLAVRSSAVEEDGEEHSFAGQFETVLGVGLEGLEGAVGVVRRSGESVRAEEYRRLHGLGAGRAPAVMVQRMVMAEASGVAFGVDPVSGRKDVAVVAAVRGTAEGLAAGSESGDTWEVGVGGEVKLRTGECGERVIGDGVVRAVAELVRRAGEEFGVPQDVEWVWESGRLRLIQSRPVTAVRGAVEATLWDNSNIVESYGGITLPLTFTFARRAYAAVYREFCRMLAVPEARVAASDAVFEGMLGQIRGRVYYNLLNWYRLLALLPGYRLNRGFMEQMMGVREPLPEAVAEGIGREVSGGGVLGRVMDGVHVSRGVVSLVVAHWRLPRTIRRFRERLDGALRLDGERLEDWTAEELVAHSEALEERLLTKWDAPLLNDFFAMIFFGVLRGLVRKWVGDGQESLANELLCGEGGMVSAVPAARLRRMAVLAEGRTGLEAALRSGSVGEVEAAMGESREFAEEWRRYLEEFGERCHGELKLENATLHDDAGPLVRAVARLLGGGEGEPGGGQAAAVRAVAETRVAGAMRGRLVKGVVFRWVLRQARGRVRDRENLRFERTRVFGRARRIYGVLGTRLEEAGRIETWRDVFLLEVDEVRAVVRGGMDGGELRRLVGRRRAELAAWEAAPVPPARFVALGRPDDASGWEVSGVEGEEERGERRKGVGCCPGMVRGRVRCVVDPVGAEVERGEILVAARTDPGWILLFPAAAAILVERGSLLSHAAIVARELGIPAVVGVPGLMGWLADGDEVWCDGSTGEVIRLGCGDEECRESKVPK
jgi:rifampicin phosphotransferase